MTTILPSATLNSAQAGTSSKSGSISGSRDPHAAAARRQALDVEVTTTDGDRFVLAADRITAVAASTYGVSSSGGFSQLVAQYNAEASISASRVAVALSGDVDAEEAKDIARAVKELVKALRDTAKEHLAQAAHRTERLAKLDTVATAAAATSTAVVGEFTVSTSGE